MVSDLVKRSRNRRHKFCVTEFVDMGCRPLTQMDVMQITVKYCELMHNMLLEPSGVYRVAHVERACQLESPQGSSSHAKANNFNASRACARR
jgi:hypothetical protein